jgi:hypothetical protein
MYELFQVAAPTVLCVPCKMYTKLTLIMFVCSSICPHDTTREPSDVFGGNLAWT